jgi:hypothetical protein
MEGAQRHDGCGGGSRGAHQKPNPTLTPTLTPNPNPIPNPNPHPHPHPHPDRNPDPNPNQVVTKNPGLLSCDPAGLKGSNKAVVQSLANVVNGVEGSFVPVWKSLWSKDTDS